MRLWINLTALLAMLAVAGEAHASKDARTFHDTRPLKSSGSLSVHNVSGSVKIIGTDQELVEIDGRMDEGVEGVTVTGQGDSVSIVVDLKKHGHSDSEARLEIRVPRNARLDIDCVSADITARDVTGAAILNTVSGDLRIGGELKTIELKTVSGDIHIEAVGERLIAQSVSGDIAISHAIGEVELETVSGDMKIDSAHVSRFRAKSVSGDVILTGDISGRGTSSIESHSGDVVLELGDHTDASFECHTFSGEISGRGEGQKPARFLIGAGNARVSIHTFSGDIRVRTP